MYMRELTNEEFGNLCTTYQEQSIYQSVEYAHVMNKEKFDSMYIGLIDNDHIIAGSLLLIEKIGHFKYAYAPKGFLLDYLNPNLVNIFTQELKKFLGKKNIVAVKLCPMIIKNTYDFKHNVIIKNEYFDYAFKNLQQLGYYHYGFNEFFESLKPRYEATLDIGQPEYLIFKSLTKHLRTKIRSAENTGIKIYKGNKEDLKYLYLHTKKKYIRNLKYYENCYDEFSRSNSIEFFYAKLDTKKHLEICQEKYLKQEEICLQNNEQLLSKSSKFINKKIEDDKKIDYYKKEMIKATKLLKNHPEGIILASAMIVIQKEQVYLFMDGYNPTYKSFNAKHLLLWKLCERYSKKGYKTFNLGGIAGVNAKENPYKGLNDFKLNFNAKIIEYLGDLEIITNNALYFMYQNTKPIHNILKK